MNLYEHTIIAKQNFTKSQLDTIKNKYTNLIKKNNGDSLRSALRALVCIRRSHLKSNELQDSQEFWSFHQ